MTNEHPKISLFTLLDFERNIEIAIKLNTYMPYLKRRIRTKEELV
jgi:hypothetical protein